MKYRRFGKTELSMPVVSCGGMRYQFDWKDKPLEEIPNENQENLEATIRRSVELGINHIETARGYGSSERQLGLILPEFPRDEIIVQTKIGPNEKTEEFIKGFEESLERLKLDNVDLLSIHGINHAPTLDWSVRKGGCLEAARKFQDQGLAKHIGFSTHGPTDIIVKAIETDVFGGFDYVNLHWYYINQLNWPAIEAAAKRDMGVFIISPTDKGGMLHKPSEKIMQLTEPLHPIVFNDLFCLMQEKIHTISIGASCPDDFNLHIEAVELLDNAANLVAPIVEKLENAKLEAVGEKLANPFDLDIPDWDKCPDGINARVIVWLWMLLKTFDLIDYGKSRFNLMGNAEHWFPGEKPENFDNDGWHEIADQSGLGDQLLDILREAKETMGGEEVKRLSKSE